ncbi:MAG: UDP-N-acetylmuramoyl-tripeptide--D-alanyl-D-alanine ligase [Oscillospiraceae bacterium]|nr:UDP-N-acetylmuramoyl-tripeptide--D-alanyl-D-alanine ligase [Oscillospiraceae bacterium]
MKNLTIENIICAVHGVWHGDTALLGREIASVTTDSRSVEKDCLFAAIKGENNDGHDYIGLAIEKGALCVLAERSIEGSALPTIVVQNTVEALGDLAAFYRRQFDIPVLGITGSVGKTTAKEMVSAVLSHRFKVHKTAKNLNNDLGVPLTLFGLNESHEFAVIEMGISHFGEMRRLAEIVRPDMALYTSIGSAHLEFLGDFDGVLKAKSELLEFLPNNGIVFVNGDNEALQKLSCEQEICRYGVSRGCDVTAENIRLFGTDGMELEIVSGSRRIHARINSFGVHMVTAALGAAAVGIHMGLTNEEILDGIAAYIPVGSRSGIIKTDKITIIDDCYNANPTSVAAAIDSLSLLPNRRVCILGDMGELGKTAARLHFETGLHAAEKGVDLVIACGELSASTAEGAKNGGGNVLYFEEKSKLLSELPRLIEYGDAVLVKASHSRKFEEIVEALINL